MLLRQALEELSFDSLSETQERVRGTEDAFLPRHRQRLIGDLSVCCDNDRSSTCVNHTEGLVAPTASASKELPWPVTNRSAAVSRHTSAANSQYLYKAAVAAKEISVAGHGRLSAPALLANCLLSMISIEDDDSATGESVDKRSSASNVGRKTLLKSFSQLRAEERDAQNAHHQSSHSDLLKKLQVSSCCLFPCNKRSISSTTMARTLELLSNSDDLSFSSEEAVSGCRPRANGEGGGGLRNLLKKVLCKGRSTAVTGSSLGDHEIDLDGLQAYGTPISSHMHVHMGSSDKNMENHISSLYDDTCGNGHYGDLLQQVGVGKRALQSELDGGVPQEVVHEVTPFSHDAPVSSSFVFEESYFWPSSYTSSTLVSDGDRNLCNIIHHNNLPVNHLLQRVVQDDRQLRLANKRLNLSR